MFVEEAALELTKIAWDERSAIARFARDIGSLVRKGRLRIFVFGPGGVGKTTFGEVLAGRANFEEISADYNVTLRTRQYTLSGKNFVHVIVPPGQAHLRGAWDELYREISKSRRVGIVNFVCWGYESVGDGDWRRHSLYRDGMSLAEFSELYFSNRRKEELTVLEELAPHLKSVPGKYWMMTLLTKQDLWWAERHRVQDHYEAGRYNNVIEEILRHKGAGNFTHIYQSVSLNFVNLRMRDGVGHSILAPTTSGYDKALMTANLNETLRRIRDLLDDDT